MPLTTSNFIQIAYQRSNYVHTEDKSNWTDIGKDKTKYAIVLVAENKKGALTLEPTDIPHQFSAVAGTELLLHFYAVHNRIPTAGMVENDCLWQDDKVYRCLTRGQTRYPSDDPTNWQMLTNSTAALIDTAPNVSLKYHTYFRAVSVSGDFQLINNGDHSWTINSDIGNMTKIILKTYDLVETAVYNFNDDTFTLLTPSDGLWIAEITMADGTTNYVEIYDFTEIERCYLDLMRNTLCECIDCKDCPDEGYTRALTFANMYLLIRDIAYADRWAAGGFTSTEILRTDYVNTYGMLIEKLKLMSDNCTCNE